MQILTTNVEETTTGTLVPSETVATEAAPSALDNILTLGLVAVLALVVIIAVIRKAMSNKKAETVVNEEPEVAAEPVEAPTAPGAAGEVKLYNVEPKTAAMLMAIVAGKMQRPINELRFISIKEVE